MSLAVSMVVCRCWRGVRGGRARRCAGYCKPFSRWKLAGLVAARCVPWPLLGGTALLLGYYLNELLLKLLPRDDAHQRLFDDYASIVQQLARQGREHGHTAPLLRRFEQSLLAELGYGLSLTQEAQTGTPVQAAGRYHYRVEQGPVALAPREAEGMPDGQVLYGKTLLDMANNDYTDPRTLVEAKQLMRTLIHHHLAGKPLQSRRIFVELMELS